MGGRSVGRGSQVLKAGGDVLYWEESVGVAHKAMTFAGFRLRSKDST